MSSPNGSNPAALDGWVKSTDPRTGRIFYANHLTRKTQWEPPPGWTEDLPPPSSSTSVTTNGGGSGGSNGTSSGRSGSSTRRGSTGSGGGGGGGGGSNDEEPELPANWEVMHDPTTGRPFYVDHERRITTWEHPGLTAKQQKQQQQQGNQSSSSSGNALPSSTTKGGTGSSSGGNTKSSTSTGGGTKTGFGFVPKSTLNNNSSANGTSGGGGGGVSWVEDVSSNSASASAVPPRKLQSAQSYTRRLASEESSDWGYTPNSSATEVTHNETMGLSGTSGGAFQPLDFTVQQVADELRPNCPSCNTQFTALSKRKHHCRLCGDVFCDACSSHRVLLPLDGPQFEKPVRICDSCNADVSRGNYFSMRRYLTPLQLFDPGLEGANEDRAVRDVAAALSALAADLDGILLDTVNYEEKLTIPPEVLVGAIVKHLVLKGTSDRAVRALSSLLALGNVVGDDEYAHAVYTHGGKSIFDAILDLLEWSGTERHTLAVQEQAARAVFYLSDPGVIKTLLAKEQSGAISRPRRNDGDSEEKSSSEDQEQDQQQLDLVDALDVHRTLRNMLDHTTSSSSSSLQRWAAASIRNLVSEDQRRSCMAVNDAASHGTNKLRYTSFLSQLVSTGGVMILCSLIGADDGDTRAHATAALSATVVATRAIDASLTMLAELTGTTPPNKNNNGGGGEKSDAAIVQAIVSGGGCGSNLAQLLLSADDTVAGMGCAFASSLVMPLLTDPRGSTSRPSGNNHHHGNDDEDGLNAYRQAALALANDEGCLPALMSLLRDPHLGGRVVRPVHLKKVAMETMAAISLAVGYLGSALSDEEEDEEEENHHYDTEDTVEVRSAIYHLEQENAVEIAYNLFESTSSASLISSRDSPAGQLREAAGLVLSGMASCSKKAVSYLRVRHAVSVLLIASGEEGMSQPSTLRGEWAPRCLGMMEAAASVLVAAWSAPEVKKEGNENESGSAGGGVHDDLMMADEFKHHHHHNPRGGGGSGANGRNTSRKLDLLLEAIDAGAVPTCSSIVSSKVEFHNHDKAYGSIRMKMACCQLLSAMFGIAWSDSTSIGTNRLYDAVDDDAGPTPGGGGGVGGGGGGVGGGGGPPGYNNSTSSASSSGGAGGPPGYGSPTPNNLVTATVSLLQSTANHAQHYAGGENQLPLMDLTESALLAVGSMCGARIGCLMSQNSMGGGGGGGVMSNVQMTSDDFSVPPEDDFTPRRQMACIHTCNLLVAGGRSPASSLLPTMFVGGYGEGSVIPALRLALSIAQNGPLALHAKLSQSGILIPTSDILKNALVEGDRYTFSASLALVRFSGPHVTAGGGGESGGLQAVRESILCISNVLSIAEETNADPNQLATLRALKVECVRALEALSTNASLWSFIAKHALPSITAFLLVNDEWDGEDKAHRATLCAALRTVQRVIPLPSHAVAAARAGIGKPLARLICGRKETDEVENKTTREGRRRALRRERERRERPPTMEDDVQLLSLEVLHTLASHSEARRGDDKGSPGLLHSGAVGAACFALGSGATAASVSDNPNEGGTSSAQSITKLGLEILQYILSDLEYPPPVPPPQHEGAPIVPLGPVDTPAARTFVQAVARQSRFIRALCATMLLQEQQKPSDVQNGGHGNEQGAAGMGGAVGMHNHLGMHQGMHHQGMHHQGMHPQGMHPQGMHPQGMHPSHHQGMHQDMHPPVGGRHYHHNPPPPMGSMAMPPPSMPPPNMPVPHHPPDTPAEHQNYANDEFAVAPLYGSPFVTYEGVCAGFPNSQQAATATLFSIAALCSSVENKLGEAFWETFLVMEERKLIDNDTKMAAAAAASAVFLNVLADEEEGVCIPRNGMNERYYFEVSLPLVRKRLLDGLRLTLEDTFLSSKAEGLGVGGGGGGVSSSLSLLKKYHVLEACLSLCTTPTLLEPAYKMIKGMVSTYPDDILPLMVEERSSVLALLSLLNRTADRELCDTPEEEMRRLFAQILSTVSERGLLGPAVERLELRSKAIAALTAACLADDGHLEEEEHKEMEEVDFGFTDKEPPKTISVLCLQSLVGIFATPPKTAKKTASSKDAPAQPTKDGAVKRLFISPTEAKAIAATLGRKISDLVLARFLERASHTSDAAAVEEHDEFLPPPHPDDDLVPPLPEESITDAPEVIILCALASSKEALPDLCKNGGLEALSLVATEGELSAILAMHEACKDDPSVILQVDGHVSVMDVLAASKKKKNASSSAKDQKGKGSKTRAVESACLELLATFCRGTSKGRMALSSSEQAVECMKYASEVITSITKEEEQPPPSPPPPSFDEIKGSTASGDDDAEEGDAPTEGEDEGDTTDGNEQEEAPKATTPTPPPPRPPLDFTKVTKEYDLTNVDRTLELAAFAFLSELVHIDNLKELLLADVDLALSSSKLALQSIPVDIQYAAVNFLSRLSVSATNYSTSEAKAQEGRVVVSSGSLAQVFCSILNRAAARMETVSSAFAPRSSRRSSAAIERRGMVKGLDMNMVLAAASCGVESVLDDVTVDDKVKVVGSLSTLFVKLVQKRQVSVSSITTTVPKNGFKSQGGSSSSSGANAHSGLLACNITTLFLLMVADPSIQDALLQSELITAMMRLILLNAAATSEGNAAAASSPSSRDETDETYWQASLTLCLQCLSTFMRNSSSQGKLGVGWSWLIAQAEGGGGGSSGGVGGSGATGEEEEEADGNNDSRFEATLRDFVANRENGANSVAAMRILQRIGSMS